MQWLSVPQAAAALGCSERTLYNWLRIGKVERRKRDGKTQVLVDLDTEPVQCNPADELRKIVAAEVATKGLSYEALRKTTEAFQSMTETLQQEARWYQRTTIASWLVAAAAVGMIVYGTHVYEERISTETKSFYRQMELAREVHRSEVRKKDTELADLQADRQADAQAVQADLAVAAERITDLEHELTATTDQLTWLETMNDADESIAQPTPQLTAFPSP